MDTGPLLRTVSTNRASHAGAVQDDCCYSRCSKTSGCGGKCSYWRTKKTSDCLILTFSILSAVAVFLAIIIPLLVDGLLDVGINESLVVDSTDAPGYDTFLTNTRDGDQVVHCGVYYFDVQNPEEILTGERPKLLERGPYMYREYFYKFEVEWKKGGEHVSYYQWKYFIFDEANSAPGVDPADNITQAYFSALTMEKILIPMEPQLQAITRYAVDQYFAKKSEGATPAEKAQYAIMEQAILARLDTYEMWSLFYKIFLCESPYGVSPFQTRSAHDLYWGWFNDPLFSLLKPIAAQAGVNLTASIPGIAVNYTSIDDAKRRTNKNLVHTGKNDIKKMSNYQLYQNSSEMWVCLLSQGGSDEEEIWPCCPHFQEEWNATEAEANGFVLPWATPWANRIDGTDGVQFGRIVTSDLLQAFISDIYSTRFLEKQSSNDDFHGIPLNRYGLRDIDLENASVVPANAQFYQFGPKGLSNFTQAVGIPLFASKPHYLDSDPRLGEALIGMRPTREVHDTFLDVEENTGVVMRARKRLQVSNYLYQTELMTLTEEDATMMKEIIIAIICKNKTNCTDADALVQCLSHTYVWDIVNGGVYLPYTWTDEYYDLNNDDATSIKEDVIDTQNFATAAQLWLFVAAGIFVLLAGAVYVTRYVVRGEHAQLSPGLSQLLGDDYEAPTFTHSQNLDKSTVF